MTESRRPLHLGVILGVSAGVYAVSLAGVTALEVRHEARDVSAAEPATRELTTVGTNHDRLASSLDAAESRFGAAAAGYQRLSSRLDALESSLGRLAGTVGAVEGTSVTLPSHVSLPAVPTVTTITRVAAAPVTHATTGASGKP